MGVRHLHLLLVLSLFLTVTGVANATTTIYYTYNGNVTKELYIGGCLHFPKSFADRIKVTGGVIEQENENEWVIKVTNPAVTVEYIKLNDKDFSYSKKNFVAKVYPADLFKPVEPDEMRITLKDLNKNLASLTNEITTVKLKVKEISERPSFEERLVGFFVYNPVIYPLYIVIGVLGILYVLGSRW